MNLGERLRLLRKEAGLTQEELAQKIGKTRSAVAGYEAENKEPGIDTLVRLAQIFGVSLEYLIGMSDIKKRNVLNMHSLYIPEDYRNKHEIKPEDIKDYLKFMRSQIGILFMDDRISEEDKDALLRDVSELYWKAKDMKKQRDRGTT